MPQPLALIVDDEPDIRELLEITLGRMNINTRSAGDLGSARDHLQKESFDLCLTDMRLPDGNGIELVELINRQYPQLPVAMITAHGNMDSAVLALKAGAFDFVSKPVDLRILRRLVESALKLDNTPPLPTTETETETETASEADSGLQGKSAAIEKIRAMTRKLARNQAPVYISGESGSGKELAAHMIHNQGPRDDHEFIAVNCGAIPQELMESEFFGHKRGSFTGAVTDKEGLFQAADGGTLFLDEVADLPLHMQVKLLRAIQEKSIRPVGAQKEIPVDVRLISATHKDLGKLVAEGAFRQDLFYRINVIELQIPPLRERREDIALLTDRILSRIAEQNSCEKPRVEREALKALYSYTFPGNVRELENILERASALCDESMIGLDDLALPDNNRDTPQPEQGLPLEEHLEKIERIIITRALEETRWNKTAAAKKLGISFRALRYRLDKLGIN
ncbi:MAG: sigma-54 dependent transcriptional regulator [Candidatus Sedimenticola sp. (ex Thyasira tokunagai)]